MGLERFSQSPSKSGTLNENHLVFDQKTNLFNGKTNTAHLPNRDNNLHYRRDDIREPYGKESPSRVGQSTKIPMTPNTRTKFSKQFENEQKNPSLIQNTLTKDYDVISDRIINPRKMMVYTPQLERRKEENYETPMLSGRRFPAGPMNRNSPQLCYKNIDSSPRSEKQYGIQNSPQFHGMLNSSRETNFNSPVRKQIMETNRDRVQQGNVGKYSHSKIQSPQDRIDMLNGKPIGPINRNQERQHSFNREGQSPNRNITCKGASSLGANVQQFDKLGKHVGSIKTLKKGLLWMQQDKLFSPWKERFVILTNDFLQVYKRSTSRISDIGAFIFKVSLTEIISVTLEDKRGYLSLVVNCKRDGRLNFRCIEGIGDWRACLEKLVRDGLQAIEIKMQSTKQFWNRSEKNQTQNTHNWLMTREARGQHISYHTPPTVPRYSRDSPLFSPSSSSETGQDDSGFESLVTIPSNNSESGSTVSASPSYIFRNRVISPDFVRVTPDRTSKPPVSSRMDRIYK